MRGHAGPCDDRLGALRGPRVDRARVADRRGPEPRAGRERGRPRPSRGRARRPQAVRRAAQLRLAPPHRDSSSLSPPPRPPPPLLLIISLSPPPPPLFFFFFFVQPAVGRRVQPDA